MRALSLVLVFAAATRLHAQSDANCPSGNDDIRVAALSGLAQLESDQVLPALKKILERRDVCSIALRRQAISLLTRSKYGDQTDALLDVVRRDADDDVRRYALQAIARLNTDKSTSILDSIASRGTELESRETALRALAQESNPLARAAVKRVAENANTPLDLRVRSIVALYNGRRQPDDAAYYMALYEKAEPRELREALLRAVASQRTAESTTWLLGIARDKNKDIEIRRQALYAIGQVVRANETGTGAPIDLGRMLALYDDFAGQLEMQDRALDMIAQRPESAATDKLFEIARNEKNPDLKRKAVLRIGQRRDPRVRDFLLEVLAK